MLIQLHNASIHKISTLADKTLKIELYQRELPPKEMEALFRAYMSGKEGIEISATPEEGKSPAERLRNVIYRFWETTSKEKEFDTFYKSTMEHIINQFKAKL